MLVVPEICAGPPVQWLPRAPRHSLMRTVMVDRGVEAEAYVALIKLRLFVLAAFHFPVGRKYSFSSSHDFFNCEACIASSWVNAGVQ